MPENSMTTEQVLRMIKKKRGEDALRDKDLLFSLFFDFSKNQLRPQKNYLRVFLDCQGNTRILDLQNASQHTQQVEFNHLVHRMVNDHGLQETVALDMCSIFWRVAVETAPPQYSLRQLPPVSESSEPVLTAEEMYQRGQNCNQNSDYTEAAHWYQKAAEQGHTGAMLRLGFAYENGLGVTKYGVDAVKWFRKAAELGYAPAQDRMAYCYDKGLGVDRNLEKAIEWCKKACDQDFPGAQRHLRQLESKLREERSETILSKPKQDFEILNDVLVKYNGSTADVTVPNGVKRIGARAFENNQTIRSVKLPDTLLGISNAAFSGCTGLKEAIIPGSVVAVDLGCFAQCHKLKRLELQPGVQKLILGQELTHLYSLGIVVPDTVTSVTWSSIPDTDRAIRMRHPKYIIASERWASTFSKFLSENPDFRCVREQQDKKSRLPIVLGAIFLVLSILCAAFVFGNTSNQTQEKLAPFALDASLEALILEGAEDSYVFPDGSFLEMYFDDSGKERCRIYFREDGTIEYLFTAEYDADGNMLRHLSYDGKGTLLRADTHIYDPDGNAIGETIQLEGGKTYQTKERVFSQAGKLESVAIWDGKSNLLLQGSSAYDDAGTECYTATKQDGTSVECQYDTDGNLISNKQFDAAGNIQSWWQYTYRPDGKEIRGTRYHADGTESQYYTLDYDEATGRKLKQHWYDPDGTEFSTVTYLYGPRDILVGEMDDQSGEVRTDYYVESILGNTIKQFIQSTSGDYSSNTVITYDMLDNWLEYRSYEADGTLTYLTEYMYDEDSVCTGSTSTYYAQSGSQIITQYNGYDAEISSESYDASGNLTEWSETELDDMGREKKTNTYSADGRLTHILERGYDEEGNILQYTRTYMYEDGTYEVTVSDGGWNQQNRTKYDAAGNATEITEFEYEYDSNGNILKQIACDEYDNVRYWLEYTYDADGNQIDSQYFSNG